MLQVNHVTKKYGNAIILENSSYTFPSKGIVCLMGASGGGKTTLLNLLAGFDTDYEGEILVGGTLISGMDAEKLCQYRRDNIGFVFQNYHLLPGYTASENVLLASALSKDSPDASRQKAATLLTRLGIGEKENQKVENLSGGQKQRVAIARALMSDPQIIFADEPTGALDRTTSTEIMKLLQEISRDRLVVVITHDAKICEFADEIIHIKEKKIIEERVIRRDVTDEKALVVGSSPKISIFSRAVKNFKVHLTRYAAVSLSISIGLLAFLFSLSFGNVMERSIDDFKTKNTAFNNGYIKGADDGTILEYLKKDERIENVYYQYKLRNLTLSTGDKSEQIAEKFPTPKATESLSYGVMPRLGQNEIAITPSLAKKFDSDIKKLLGKEFILELDGQKHKLTMSGIYNAGYDDFIVSSDIEQQFYKNITDEKNYSISYDVKEFSDIVGVSNVLKLRGITAKTASDEVYALQNTFHSLNKLFLVISFLILAISLFICTILLNKLQNTRYHEIGLLSALGFSRQQISSMIRCENLLLSSLATVVNLILLFASILLGKLLDFALIFTGAQVVLSIVATFAIVMLLSAVASYKLIRTEPAIALKK
ncbi:ABC transporter ATP-binding protein/permease [Lachnoclostridium phytofermentans]|uniref:ABC transporter related n=1 Tax=Lachnoclostridium phytofermentans (strain ATCC 700394 / DSM 18823 / ISDg) TaxID=357809 RepID=A9KRB1_LACP7|nr:ABC transporter ATP-binding protein/permease [Lachnoclostridium phytofermentans]ABX40579.1 ABC transporter related [Lachnoclostridium phytofermentans ISDg]